MFTLRDLLSHIDTNKCKMVYNKGEKRENRRN